MATKKKMNRKPGRAGRIALASLAGLMIALLALVVWGAINASVVRVRRAEVALEDLPAAFDGVTLLYAADIDLCGLNTAEKSADLFRRLQDLEPDVLLLGGDYSSPSLLDTLNGSDDAMQLTARAAFIQSLSEFKAPLGKYAVRTREDPDAAGLSAALEAAGIQPLFDAGAKLTSKGKAIHIVGFTGYAGGVVKAAGAAKHSDCVLAMSPDPSLISQIMINEASDGGAWCDLLLTGHTHGGQVMLFDRSALALNDADRAYFYGWKVENDIPILTTSGVGCEGLNVRLGSRPEVWLITLRRKSVLPDLR